MYAPKHGALRYAQTLCNTGYVFSNQLVYTLLTMTYEDWCRWWDSNPHDFLRSQDFKSCVSAISPHRQCCFYWRFRVFANFHLTLRHFSRHCYGMQPIEAVSSQQTNVGRRKSHSRYEYKKVLDGRKQPIRGLWERNGKFVARIATEDEDGMKRTCWVPLAGAVTVAQAQEQLKTLHVDRARNELPVLKRTPKFADYADHYLAYFETVKDAKRPATIQKERGAINLWKAWRSDSPRRRPDGAGQRQAKR